MLAEPYGICRSTRRDGIIAGDWHIETTHLAYHLLSRLRQPTIFQTNLSQRGWTNLSQQGLTSQTKLAHGSRSVDLNWYDHSDSAKGANCGPWRWTASPSRMA
jgi:hypothetical protein